MDPKPSDLPQDTRCPIHGWNLRARHGCGVFECERCGFSAMNIRNIGVSYRMRPSDHYTHTSETWEQVAFRLETGWWDT